MLIAGSISAQEIAPKDVPAPVFAKFNAFYGDAKKVKWEKENERYEASFKDAAKKKMSITFNADGNIYEKEWEVKKKELPKTIADSLMKKFPAAKILEIEKIDRSGLVLFEIETAIEENKIKKGYAICFTEDGKLYTKEEIKLENKKNNKPKA